MKMIRILHFLLPLCCLPFCLTADNDVVQSPPYKVVQTGESVSMDCSDDRSSNLAKYWYRQKDGALVQIAYSYNAGEADMEKDFPKDRFLIKADTAMRSSLTISKVSLDDNANYFCASTGGNNVQYFGGGTTLHVLGEKEKQIEPKVRLFPPDKQEFKEHGLLSLVCVASGFFPEHVRLTWYLNNEKIESMYQNVPKLDTDNTYSTSSRLSLMESQYFNPDTKIRCEAAFVGSNITASDETHGELGCGVSKESYGRYMNQGKISYIMVMFKSGLYAVIVMAVIWRRKALSGSC